MPNISRSKDKQTIKFGHLIEYNMKNSFLKINAQNLVEKLYLYPFLKNQSWAYLWINILSFVQFVFIVWQVEGFRNILKLSCRPLPFTLYKVSLENKDVCYFAASLSAWFLKKIFLLLYSINWPKFIVWSPLLHEILSNMCTAIVCLPGCAVSNFEINLIFLSKPYFTTKIKMFWEQK